MAEELIEIRQIAERFRASLPKEADVAALGVKSRAPFQALCAREALMWRTEELVRTACDALERNDCSVAAILARAVAENTALLWKVMNILDGRGNRTPQVMNDVLIRVLVGSKQWKDLSNAYHVNVCIEEIEKSVPGFQSTYDQLSEIAHPNWAGVLGLYSRTDSDNFITYFGRGLRDPDGARDMIANALLGSLGLFELSYNKIADALLEYITELEKIWPEQRD